MFSPSICGARSPSALLCLPYTSQKSNFTPLFPEEGARDSSELQPSPTLPTVWSHLGDNLEQFHPLTPSPDAPLRLIQLAEPIPEAAGRQGRNCLGETTPTQPRPRVLAGLGCSPCSPRGEHQGKCIFRGGRAGPGSGQGEQDRVGMFWECHGCPAQRERVTAQPPVTPQP